MWWGGTNPDESGEVTSPRVVEPEGSSEGSGSPPVDLMAEEEEDDSTKTIGADQVNVIQIKESLFYSLIITAVRSSTLWYCKITLLDRAVALNKLIRNIAL